MKYLKYILFILIGASNILFAQERTSSKRLVEVKTVKDVKEYNQFVQANKNSRTSLEQLKPRLISADDIQQGFISRAIGGKNIRFYDEAGNVKKTIYLPDDDKTRAYFSPDFQEVVIQTKNDPMYPTNFEHKVYDAEGNLKFTLDKGGRDFFPTGFGLYLINASSAGEMYEDDLALCNEKGEIFKKFNGVISKGPPHFPADGSFFVFSVSMPDNGKYRSYLLAIDRDGNVLWKTREDVGNSNYFTISKDGSKIAVGSGNTVHVFNGKDGVLEREYNMQYKYGSRCALSANGRYLAVVNRKPGINRNPLTSDMYLFDNLTGEMMWKKTIKDAEKMMAPTQITISDDGSIIFIKFAYEGVHVYDEKGQTVGTIDIGQPSSKYTARIIGNDLIDIRFSNNVQLFQIQ